MGYVCGADQRYIGMVSASSLIQAMERSAALDAALLEAPPVAADRPLRGVIQAAARYDHPVPVVDNDGAFRGAVSQGQLLQTLTQKADRGH